MNKARHVPKGETRIYLDIHRFDIYDGPANEAVVVDDVLAAAPSMLRWIQLRVRSTCYSHSKIW